MFRLEISISRQCLSLFHDNILLDSYSVSTALNGAGEQKNSGCTPRGKHIVRALIGRDLAEGAVLVGRRFTGEIYTDELGQTYPDRDWILTRIIWLSGTEIGKNRLGNVDTMQRYIYIHGTPESEPMGIPLSHGCIRMRNKDITCLFDRIPVGTEVTIKE